MITPWRAFFSQTRRKLFGDLSSETRKFPASQSHISIFVLDAFARKNQSSAARIRMTTPFPKHFSDTDKMPKRHNERKANHPKKVQKFAHEDHFENVEYFFENGLRKIKPYVYKFECHAKGRWFGSKLLDVFKKEFRLETAEYYETAIQEGLIKVNKGRASPDRILQNNDFMSSKVHRHEPPVSGQPIQILAETDEYLVINKPASIPVHPCGKYRHNTIVFILGKEYGFKGLHTIHRLDRLTSGLLLFARTLEVSHRLDAYVRDRLLEKTYVCKVQGEFPSEPVECSEPIFIVSHKIGVCRVREDGKMCHTKFERLSYDGESSIVKCYPHTGRMHQIRVHLQYMGFPIANDPLYNNTVWGEQKGKGGTQLSDEELLKDLIEQHDMEIDSALEKARIQSKLSKKSSDKSSPTTEGSTTQGTSENINQIASSRLADTEGPHSSVVRDKEQTDSHCQENSEELQRNVGVDANIDQVEEIALPKIMEEHTAISSENNMQMEDSNRTKTSPTNANSESVVCSSVFKSEGETNRTVQCDAQILGELKREESGDISLVRDEMSSGSEVKCASARSLTDLGGRTMKGETQGDCDKKMELGDRTITKEPDARGNRDQMKDGHCTETVGQQNKNRTSEEGNVKNEKGGNTKRKGKMKRQELDEKEEDERTDRLVVSLCRECQNPMPDPEMNEMCIYLHALTYKGPGFEFSAPMPAWAEEHFTRTGTTYTS